MKIAITEKVAEKLAEEATSLYLSAFSDGAYDITILLNKQRMELFTESTTGSVEFRGDSVVIATVTQNNRNDYIDSIRGEMSPEEKKFADKNGWLGTFQDSFDEFTWEDAESELLENIDFRRLIAMEFRAGACCPRCHKTENDIAETGGLRCLPCGWEWMPTLDFQ